MDHAISIENLSKRFRIDLKERMSDSLGGAIANWLKSPVSNFNRVRNLMRFEDEDSEDIIWALKEISFIVTPGEVVGIIGRNGAGKSTLLKIISRITKPTSGRAVLKGRVASLLEVGTGFHMDLTGRENVYLNATILGMSKREVDKKFDEIVHFSGVEKFIDTPFKRYSSGMKVRLGFSVAAHLEAEILLVDEVLAVGDIAFQKKCIGRMHEIASEGRTVLFVSHEMAAVERLCPRSILLENGRLIMDGLTHDVVGTYVGLQESAALEWVRNTEPPEHAYLQRVTAIDATGEPLRTITTASHFGIEIECVVRESIPNQKIGVTVRDSHESPIFFTLPIDYDVPYPTEPGTYIYRVFFPEAFFMAKRYIISAAIWSGRVWSDNVLRALTLDVEPGVSLGTTETGTRPGIIQVHCRWEMHAENSAGKSARSKHFAVTSNPQ